MSTKLFSISIVGLSIIAVGMMITATPVSAANCSATTFKVGSKGACVRELQTKIKTAD